MKYGICNWEHSAGFKRFNFLIHGPVKSQFFKPPKGNKNWFKKCGELKVSGVKILRCPTEEREWLLVQVIGRLAKLRVWETGIWLNSTFVRYFIRAILKQLQRMFRLYLCFNRRWIFLTAWTGTQKGMHALHVCLLSWTIFWNCHWTLKEKVRKFQLLNYQYFITVSSSRMTVWMLWKEKLPHTSAPWGMGLTTKNNG